MNSDIILTRYNCAIILFRILILNIFKNSRKGTFANQLKTTLFFKFDAAASNLDPSLFNVEYKKIFRDISRTEI